MLGKGIIFSKLTLSNSSRTGEAFGSLSQFLNQRFWGGCEILNALPPPPSPVSPLLSSAPFTPWSLLWNVKQLSPVPVTGCAMWRAPNCAQNVNAYLPHQLEHCAVCCFPEKSSGSEIITEAAKHTPAVSICKCVFVSNKYSGTGRKKNKNRSWAIIRLCWCFQGAFPGHVHPKQSSFEWEFPHLLWLLSIFQTFFNWPWAE